MSSAPAVLLVEDDPTNRLVATSMLRHIGIEADVAVNGREGVQAAARRPYDIVLMDIQMPIMDGVEAMKAIRALLPPERCPRIVAVTAHAVVGTREHMLQTGFDGFYNKPVSIAMLKEAIAPTPDATSLAPALMIRPYSQDDSSAANSLRDDVRAHVRALLGEDDEDFVSDLVETFSDTSREAVRDIASAHATGDSATVAAAAHKLKGSASNVGLTGLADSWNNVEATIRSGASMPSDTIRAAVEETERALTLLETA